MYSGDLQGQLYAFKNALEFTPDDSFVLWHLGRAYAESGQHRQAENFLTRAIDGTAEGEGEGAGHIYVDLGLNAMRLFDTAKAIEAFCKAAVLDNGIPFDWHYREIAESLRGHAQAAHELHCRLLEINTRHAQLFADSYLRH